ncbi:MAG: hypothetical protein FE045_02005 [Thermoplasmata archaeon]|jgi:post-segregation antitoxin (ccd killing protein)|nr:MAG: hypothetical protein FE045_02005 [Thermoplasmata archaeon]MCD6473988.1 hypothetical protein [Thermoplasmata archaeon]
MTYEVVSAKIPKEFKKKIKEYNINVSDVIRKAIEEEIRKREAMRIKENIEKNRKLLEKLKMKDIVAIIREDREK